MTQTVQTRSTAEAELESIRPFNIDIPEAELADLRNRILATRFPEKETVADTSQGVQLDTVRKLAKYWSTDYDAGQLAVKLNAVPHFITNIDGLDIHFIHLRSKNPNALPMILTHGWPGSVIELMKLIGPLTDPEAFGGNAEDSFDVVIPSMPGYGFSEKPGDAGWGPEKIATAWIKLMDRLGYKKYVAQGGDWGALITDMMGVQAPSELAAIHTNMAGAVPAAIDAAAFAGQPMPDGLTPEEAHSYERLVFFYKFGLSYAQEMGNHPQTLYGIADSPVGLAAWILDHDISSYELITRVFNGESEGLTRDDILDNITLYWVTNTAVSAARLYWENKLAFFSPKNVQIPAAVSVFPDEIYTVSQRWAEQAYPDLIHFNRLEKGCHFAAWEQPELFVDELRTAFRSIR